MNRSYFSGYLLAFALILFSCNNNRQETPKTDIEVATAFIRDILDNKPGNAEQYLLKDETNKGYFQSFREQYRRKDKAELDKYKASEIVINEISNITDSVSIINYSNTYKRDLKNKLKLIRINGQWLIDLKYTFSGNL